jgi:serine/threonine-protein kinase ULK/ATG1
MKPDIPEDLYAKCVFLLHKRAYATFLSLNQMLLFDSNQSGIIEIQKEDWVELSNNKQLKQELTKLRALISGDYEFSKKEFYRAKDMLYTAQIQLT